MGLRISFTCERCGASVSREYQPGTPEPKECLACESQTALTERARLHTDTDRLLAQVFPENSSDEDQAA
jgi:DNA replicative helicase MCM subunit Mcm2 (Cdc46/Mcm family)